MGNVNTSMLGVEGNVTRGTSCPGCPESVKEGEVAGSCGHCPSDFCKGTFPRAEGSEAVCKSCDQAKAGKQATGPEPTWMGFFPPL